MRTVAAAAALLSLSGCLFSDQTAAGRLLHDAPKRLARTPSVAVTVSFSSRLVHRGSLPFVPPHDPGVRFTGVMNLRTGLTEYTRPGSMQPEVVFHGTNAFALLPGANASDARPWISVVANKKLTDLVLDPTAIPASLAAFVLRPTLFLDFLSGALTGSIRRVGPATVQGVPTTEYSARFDITQGLQDSTRVHYSQKQQDDLAKLFSVLGLQPDELDNGSVWIDGRGQPRRIHLGLREAPAQDSELILTVDMELAPGAGVGGLTEPNPNTVETVPSVSQYLTPLRPRLRAAS